MLRVFILIICFIYLSEAFIEQTEQISANDIEKVTETPGESIYSTTAVQGEQTVIIVRACRSGMQRVSGKVGCKKIQ
jgi:hypothetical protein